MAQGETEALPVFGGGTRDIEVILWEMAQARYIEQSAALANGRRGALRERVPMSPRAIQQAPFRVLVGANMPAVLVEMGFITNPEQERSSPPRPSSRRSCRRSSTASFPLTDGQPRAATAPPAPPDRRPRTDERRALSCSARSSRWRALGAGCCSSSRRAAIARAGQSPAAAAGLPAADAERKITATLYFVSEDGMSLVGVQREVPFGETVLEQARQIVEAQLEPPDPRRSPPRSRGTTLRAFYLTERGDAFVDLSAEAREPRTPAAPSTSCSRSTRSSTR